MVLIVILKVF